MPRATHSLSVRINVSSSEQFSEVWQTLNLLTNGLALRGLEVAISSRLVEQDEDESDEDISYKLRIALREADIPENVLDYVIGKIREHGIDFQER